MSSQMAADTLNVFWQEAPAAGQGGGMMSTMVMMFAILGIFWFLLIRPQQKEQKAQQEMLSALSKGDKVATASGLHGKVHEVRGDLVVLEVADKVRLTVDKVSVKRKIQPEAASGDKS